MYKSKKISRKRSAHTQEEDHQKQVKALSQENQALKRTVAELREKEEFLKNRIKCLSDEARNLSINLSYALSAGSGPVTYLAYEIPLVFVKKTYNPNKRQRIGAAASQEDKPKSEATIFSDHRKKQAKKKAAVTGISVEAGEEKPLSPLSLSDSQEDTCASPISRSSIPSPQADPFSSTSIWSLVSRDEDTKDESPKAPSKKEPGVDPCDLYLNPELGKSDGSNNIGFH